VGKYLSIPNSTYQLFDFFHFVQLIGLAINTMNISYISNITQTLGIVS